MKAEQLAKIEKWAFGLLITTGADREALLDELLVWLGPRVESVLFQGERAWPKLDPRCFVWPPVPLGGVSTTQALRSALRQDPHVIAVATEIDAEALAMIEQAVLTGHFVVFAAEVPPAMPAHVSMAVFDSTAITAP